MNEDKIYSAAWVIASHPDRDWQELLRLFRVNGITKAHDRSALFRIVRVLRDDGYPVRCDYSEYTWRMALTDEEIHDYIDEYWNYRGVVTTLFRGIQSAKSPVDIAMFKILTNVLRQSAFELMKTKVDTLAKQFIHSNA